VALTGNPIRSWRYLGQWESTPPVVKTGPNRDFDQGEIVAVECGRFAPYSVKEQRKSELLGVFSELPIHSEL
jgi:hypothetical protein